MVVTVPRNLASIRPIDVTLLIYSGVWGRSREEARWQKTQLEEDNFCKRDEHWELRSEAVEKIGRSTILGEAEFLKSVWFIKHDDPMGSDSCATPDLSVLSFSFLFNSRFTFSGLGTRCLHPSSLATSLAYYS